MGSGSSLPAGVPADLQGSLETLDAHAQQSLIRLHAESAAREAALAGLLRDQTDTISDRDDTISCLQSQLDALKSRSSSPDAACKTAPAPHATAPLPPFLRDVVTIASEVAPVADLARLEREVAASPEDEAVLAALRGAILELCAGVGAVVAARAGAEGIVQTCDAVVAAGNADFRGVYNVMWDRIDRNQDKAAFSAAVSQARQRLAHCSGGAGGVRQSTDDILELVARAALAKPAFDEFVHQVTAEATLGFALRSLVLPESLKRVSRIAEKSMLRRGDRQGKAENCGDIVRCMVVVSSMDEVAAVLNAISERCSDDDAERRSVSLVRLKERFVDLPSPGGWRDVRIVWSQYTHTHAHTHIHTHRSTEAHYTQAHHTHARGPPATNAANHHRHGARRSCST